MMLAFDTATSAVTVALYDQQGDQLLASHTTVDALRHGELLAPAIQRVMAEAGAPMSAVDRIAVGVGPGPFTGLRVGIVTARTLAAALGVPLIGVCTLDVVAAAVHSDGPFMVATDARRKEVYWARYDAAGRRTTHPAAAKPTAIATTGPVAGRGATLYPEAFGCAIDPEHPDAGDLARIAAAAAVELLPADPLYLRRPDVSSPAAPKRVS